MESVYNMGKKCELPSMSYLVSLSSSDLELLRDRVLLCDKYKLCLLFVNSILVELGECEISDLCNFKNIRRDRVLSCESVYNKLSESVYKQFNKSLVGYYRRGKKGDIVNCLRGMCRELGLELVSEKVYETVSECNYRCNTYYTIKKT